MGQRRDNSKCIRKQFILKSNYKKENWTPLQEMQRELSVFPCPGKPHLLRCSARASKCCRWWRTWAPWDWLVVEISLWLRNANQLWETECSATSCTWAPYLVSHWVLIFLIPKWPDCGHISVFLFSLITLPALPKSLWAQDNSNSIPQITLSDMSPCPFHRFSTRGDKDRPVAM